MRGRLRTTASAFVVLVALVGAACGGAGAATGGTDNSPVSVEVMLSEWAISPARIEVPTGRPIAFAVMNMGTAPHTFGVRTPDGVVETPEIAVGETTSLSVPALAAGTYEVICTIAGHADLGMTGSLVASDATAVGQVGTDMAAMAGGSDGMTMTVQEMLDGHRQGVVDFPATTQGTGNEVLEPTLEDGWKVYRITASEVQWETKPGTFVSAMAYNGQIPGPELRFRSGDKVRIVVRNEMSEPTVMHFHGLTVPNAMDGVPFITQDPILPGAFFTYEFTVQDPPGMYVYHSHFNSTEQVGKGLYGSMIVEPKGGAWPYPSVTWDENGKLAFGAPPRIGTEFTMFLGDGPLGYTLNAKEFPATTPIVAKLGDWVLIHIANDGSMLHPMHLHGFHFAVVGEDGFPLAEPYESDTLVIAPGQRFDVLVHADQPGVWAFHCHILPHVEGPQGMYGMVTALVVQ
ncbi:MAG: multicopper oxidase domain-containing protein [Actinomycetota bacterium]